MPIHDRAHTEHDQDSLPDLPTVADTLPGYEVELWFGAMAPRNTPRPIIDQLNAAINKFLFEPDMKKSLEAQGLVPTGGRPGQFEKRIRGEFLPSIAACPPCR